MILSHKTSLRRLPTVPNGFKNAKSSGMVSTPVAIGSRVLFSGFQGASSQGVWVDMKVKDGKIEPVTRFQSTRLQCNAFHTVSIVDGAVYGFGTGTNQEALLSQR